MSSAKDDLRKRLISEREGLSAGEVAFRSEKIFRSFLKHADRILSPGCRSVALYYAVRGEADTRPFFDFFRKRGIACLFPRVRGEDLEFVEVRDLSELRLGAFGIPEPAPSVSPSVPSLVLLPGVAFAEDGHRLGFGKGYYDRALRRAPAAARPRLAGLAYDFQVLPALPAEGHDVQVDVVISEARVIFRSPA